MEIVVVGVNHRTANVELRERLAFTPERAQAASKELVGQFGIQEFVVLSTCNRTEFVCVSRASAEVIENLYPAIAVRCGVEEKLLREHSYAYVATDAVKHLFRVAGSLDSMVVGEPQILRQMKDAYQIAAEGNTTGVILNKLFHKAFNVGKRVRTDTAIAENAVSISYAAVELAREIFDDLGGRTALLVGAGEMAELTAKHLLSVGLRSITVVNRSMANALKLAEEFRGKAAGLNELKENMITADVVIASAAAPDILINRQMMEEVARARKFQPIFLIDIALPRNIAADTRKVEGCYLYDIDDLDRVVAKNLQNRHVEAEKAELIIEEEVEKFPLYLKSLNAVPTIRQLQNKYDGIRKAEIERVIGRRQDLTPELSEKIDYLTQSLMKKFLHEPITLLKKEESGHNDGEFAAHVRQIFGLEEDAPAAAPQAASEGEKPKE